MAAVVDNKADKKEATARLASQVDEQLAQTTSRIRMHDLAFGGLVLLALLLFYATAMILLDRYLNLAEWVRQAALGGFGLLLAAAAYFTVVSPLRKRINPLYAAKQVEQTIDDPKNSLTGYVDAQERGDLNPTVKAALAGRAAKTAAAADVNRAVDHRSLMILGAVSVAFLLTLVALFFVFRPAQFKSLAGRTFVPFTAAPIATQTQLTLIRPDPPEQTITTGQPITFAVHVGGKVPREDAPNRVRLLIRHNTYSMDYEEVPMVRGESSRDYELKLSDARLIQNGFWYKVAAGDTETPEYRVNVRSLPMFTGFTATYEYPGYLRRKTETADDALAYNIRAYRGTKVTLVARTNREQIKKADMVIEGATEQPRSEPVPGRPDSWQFTFKVQSEGKYTLRFETDSERSADPPFTGKIEIVSDQAPTVVIHEPKEDMITLPANGLLVVNGDVGDDFGIDTVTLKLRLVNPPLPLPDKPYLYGKATSFKREDGTYPTTLRQPGQDGVPGYKGSVDLGTLRTVGDKPLTLKEGDIIEYWLESSDNCTEPGPNVGRSAPKRVTLGEPLTKPEEQKNLDQQKQERAKEEQKHGQQQKDRLDKENREPPKDGKGEPQPGQQPEPKQGDPKKDGPGAGATGGNDPSGKPRDPKDPTTPKDPAMGPKGPDQPPTDPKTPKDPASTPKEPGTGPKDPSPNDPKDPNNTTTPKDPGGSGNAGTPPNKPLDPDALDKTAQDLKKELDKENKTGGSAKPNAAADPARKPEPPAESKPQPMTDGNPAEQKPEPKQPAGKDDASPATSKPEGALEKPADPSAPKPPADPKPMNPDQPKPSEQKPEPVGTATGRDKPEPTEPQPGAQGDKKQDPNSGAAAKPPTQQPEPSGSGGEEKPDPAAGAGAKSKPMGEPSRGSDKEPQRRPPTEEEKKELAEAAKNLTSDDPQKKADAQKKLDEKIGEDKRKELEQLANDLKSDDPAKRKAAEDKLKQMAKEAEDKKAQAQAGDAGDARPETPPSAGDAKPAPKDGMAGTKGMDGDTKPAAPNKPDGTAGASEAKPDTDPKTEKKGNGVAKGTEKPQPEDKGTGAATAPPPKQKLDEKQMKELADAAKNLDSPDPKTKADAQKKLDDAIGKDKREELEQINKDLKSGDPAKQKAAEDKLREMAKNSGKPDEKQTKDFNDALDDLTSDDPKKKEAAQKKLDQMVGEGNRKEIEQTLNDLDSPDAEKRAAAQKKVEDWKKQADKQAQKPEPKEPTKQDLDELAKKAQDLNSMDPAKKQQAEKEFDEKFGKEKREQLQEAMKNQKPGDPEQDQKLRDQLKDMAKGPKPDDIRDKWKQALGDSPAAKGRMTDDDPHNRFKLADMLLRKFEDLRNDAAFLKQNGWTQEEYDRFLEGYRKRVEMLRDERAKPWVRPAAVAKDTTPPKFTPGGAGKVDARPDGSTGATGGGNTVVPPGFEGLQQKFEQLIKEGQK